MTFIKIIVFAIILAVAITFFTLYRNGANLFQAPGVSERLQVYLTTNTAKTTLDHKFVELRTPQFNTSAEKLYKRVLIAAANLGWDVVAHDSDNQNANFIVFSPMFLFEDDVYVQVEFIDLKHSSLFIQSSSRQGRADLAANSGHIQTLINKLKNK